MAFLDNLKAYVEAQGEEWDGFVDGCASEVLTFLTTGDTQPLLDVAAYRYPGFNITAPLASDSSVIESGGGSSSLGVSQSTLQVPALSSVTFTGVKSAQVISVLAALPIPGTQLTPTGIIDADSVSTFDANLINGNTTDLVYNNSTPGFPVNLPGVDLGSVTPVSICRIWWWTNALYMSPDYSVQTSNDGTNWQDVSTGLSSVGLQGESVDVLIGDSVRYIRVRALEGLDANLVVISEMQVFGPSPGAIDTFVTSSDGYSITANASGDAVVENRNAIGANVTLSYADPSSPYKPPMIYADVAQQDINNDQVLAMEIPSRMDEGWSDTGSAFQYTGTPDRVRINVQVSYFAQSVRVNSVIELYRGSTLVSDSRCGYIRSTSGHNESSQIIGFTDPTPGTNPVYSLRSRREAGTGTTTVQLGYFSAEAIE